MNNARSVPNTFSALVDAHWMSPLAADLLAAAVLLGKNILVCGDRTCGRALFEACLQGAPDATVLWQPSDSPSDSPSPRSWRAVSSASELLAAESSRLGVWSPGDDCVADMMGRRDGVVGYLEAQRLDRALMRYELACAATAPAGMAAVKVLAGLDLVVTLQGGDSPRVKEIAEVVLHEAGYRPSLLFASGIMPVPGAVVPMGVPTFIDELHAAGKNVLADDLVAASRNRGGMAIPQTPREVPARRAVRPVTEERVTEPAEQGPADASAIAGMVSASFGTSSESGEAAWELETFGLPSGQPSGSEPGADDAQLAATYGLAPPRRPSNASVSFEEVLKRARTGADTGSEGDEP